MKRKIYEKLTMIVREKDRTGTAIVQELPKKGGKEINYGGQGY